MGRVCTANAPHAGQRPRVRSRFLGGTAGIYGRRRLGSRGAGAAIDGTRRGRSERRQPRRGVRRAAVRWGHRTARDGLYDADVLLIPLWKAGDLQPLDQLLHPGSARQLGALGEGIRHLLTVAPQHFLGAGLSGDHPLFELSELSVDEGSEISRKSASKTRFDLRYLLRKGFGSGGEFVSVGGEFSGGGIDPASKRPKGLSEITAESKDSPLDISLDASDLSIDLSSDFSDLRLRRLDIPNHRVGLAFYAVDAPRHPLKEPLDGDPRDGSMAGEREKRGDERQDNEDPQRYIGHPLNYTNPTGLSNSPGGIPRRRIGVRYSAGRCFR